MGSGELEMNKLLRIPANADINGRWLMVEGEVNIEDLCCSEPGRVIRMKKTDSLKYIPPSADDYARIAAMISENA